MLYARRAISSGAGCFFATRVFCSVGEELSLVLAIFSPSGWGLHSTFAENTTPTKIRMGCIANVNAYRLRRASDAAMQESLFDEARFLFEFTLRDRRGVLKDFIDAARLRFRSAVMEDAKQMVSPVRGRHAFPALKC